MLCVTGALQWFWYSGSWSCFIYRNKTHQLNRASCNQVQHPEKLELERAKVIMKQIFLFPFMWKSAEFQDLNRKRYAFLEIIQKSSTDVHCHRRNILDA